MEEQELDRGAERPRDIALVLLKSGLNALPFGGSIASLLELIPTAQQKNLEKGFDLFRQRLIELEHRIDAKAVNKDEFSELFGTCIRTMEHSHREEKLSAAANVLANFLLEPGDQAKLPYEELDHLIRCVDALSSGAIAVLGAIRAVAELRPLGHYVVDQIQFGQLRAQYPIKAEILRSLVSELEAYHLVTAQQLAIRGQGEEEYDGSHIRITPIGTTLVERFIEGRS